jgi:hypothetical protein
MLMIVIAAIIACQLRGCGGPLEESKINRMRKSNDGGWRFGREETKMSYRHNSLMDFKWRRGPGA